MNAITSDPVAPTPGAAADALRRVLSVPMVLRLWSDGPGGGEPPEAAFPGYAARLLRPADWSVADGWPAVARQPAQEFRAVGGPGPRRVDGWSVADAETGRRVASRRLSGGGVDMADGATLEVAAEVELGALAPAE